MAQDSAAFVETLAFPQLAEDATPRIVTMSAPAALDIDPKKPSASLIGGQVQSFTGGLSGQDRQDIEYITLAAQLNSDVKVPEQNSLEDTKAWFENYANVMGNLGMIMSFSWEELTASATGVTVDKVIVDVITAVASENGALIAKAAMDAVAKLDKEGEHFKLFKNSTIENKTGKFLLGVASEENGSVSLAYGAFAMDFESLDATVLWFNCKSSNVSIFKNQKVATFNQDVYKRGGREKLEQKLVGHVETFVEDLDLGF